MPKVAPEAIEPPAPPLPHLVPADVEGELVQRRPPILRSTHANVDVLDGGPAPGFDVPPKFEKLVLRRLVLRGHPRVDGHAPSVSAPAGRLSQAGLVPASTPPL